MLNGMAKTVLHIEDDALVARACARAFKHAGYDVVNVTTAELAVAALQSRSFDYIVSDFDLECGTGGDVVTWAKTMCPGVLTRWMWLTSNECALTYHDAPFMQKPAHMRDVLSMLSSIT